jgi:hypothetical protein
VHGFLKKIEITVWEKNINEFQINVRQKKKKHLPTSPCKSSELNTLVELSMDSYPAISSEGREAVANAHKAAAWKRIAEKVR